MANTLITLEEAAEGMLKAINALSPAHQQLFIYNLQTNMGGFPRDLEIEEKLRMALKQESEDSNNAT